MEQHAKKKAVLGIDNGTQGLTVLLVDIETSSPSLPIVATGEATYECIPNLPEGCYEQNAHDWEDALLQSLDQIRDKMIDYEIVAIGIAGQMHGQVMVQEATAGSEDGNRAMESVLGTVRLWCDARNDKEAREISDWLGLETPLPKRLTAARWLWTLRNQMHVAQQTTFLTTPAGWLSYMLSDGTSRALGIGDASGMFPMDATTGTYHKAWLDQFDEHISKEFCQGNHMPQLLSKILPRVVKCGEDAGVVGCVAAKRFGLPAGIPIAPAEGDQPASLVGSLIAQAGQASCSFGTSVCANVVGNTSDAPVSSPLVNHFSAVNGQPIYMVWLRNGTTFFNRMVASYSKKDDGDVPDFARIMPQVLQAPPDCGGLLSLPFLDDEPGLCVHLGGTALTLGWTSANTGSNAAGCACKSALLATIFNLRKGTEALQREQQSESPLTELVLSGGLTKTPECGQILADAFNLPVRLLEGAEEGCSWGAAVLAKYRYDCEYRLEKQVDWVEYCSSIPVKPSRSFTPDSKTAKEYQYVYEKYLRLLDLEPMLQKVVST